MTGSTMPYYRRWLDENSGRIENGAIPFDTSSLFETAIRPLDNGTVRDLVQELGCCKPPFAEMWIEHGDVAIIGPALRLSHRESLEGWSGSLEQAATDIMHERYSLPKVQVDGVAERLVNIEPGGGVTLCEVPVGSHTHTIGHLFLLVGHRPDGSAIDISQAIAAPRAGMTEALRDTAYFARSSICVALFACAVMHCKNVTTREEHLPRQLRRDRQRRGLPDIVYRTLVVGPSPGQSGGKGAPKHEKTTRLHLCRGHFAEYGPDYGKGKLFGRLEGRYWVPPHVKGSADNGRVEKTYRVEAA